MSFNNAKPKKRPGGDRFDEMYKQQELIEKKKLEIQAKIEEKKRQDTEEALKKLGHNLNSKPQLNTRKNMHSRFMSYKNNRVQEEPKPVLPNNIFSNDGSFLQQFHKLSGIRAPKIKKTSESEDDKPKVEELNDNKLDGTKLSEDKHVEVKKEVEDDASSENRNDLTGESGVLPENQVQFQAVSVSMITVPSLVLSTSQTLIPLPSVIIHTSSSSSIPQPPPLHPQNIPPPGPLQPHSIPPPSPLQPHSIPSPSPLQPHSIPAPSPLQPHSIPPPTPLQPYTIPPPSPLQPHSIPPPPTPPSSMLPNLSQPPPQVSHPPPSLSLPGPPIHLPPPPPISMSNMSIPPPSLSTSLPNTSIPPPSTSLPSMIPPPPTSIPSMIPPPSSIPTMIPPPTSLPSMIPPPNTSIPSMIPPPSTSIPSMIPPPSSLPNLTIAPPLPSNFLPHGPPPSIPPTSLPSLNIPPPSTSHPPPIAMVPPPSMSVAPPLPPNLSVVPPPINCPISSAPPPMSVPPPTMSYASSTLTQSFGEKPPGNMHQFGVDSNSQFGKSPYMDNYEKSPYNMEKNQYMDQKTQYMDHRQTYGLGANQSRSQYSVDSQSSKFSYPPPQCISQDDLKHLAAQVVDKGEAAVQDIINSNPALSFLQDRTNPRYHEFNQLISEARSRQNRDRDSHRDTDRDSYRDERRERDRDTSRDRDRRRDSRREREEYRDHREREREGYSERRERDREEYSERRERDREDYSERSRDGERRDGGSQQSSGQETSEERQERRARKRKSRWGGGEDEKPVGGMGGVGMGPSTSHPVPPPPGVALPIALGQAVPLPQNTINVPGMHGPAISQVGRTDPALLAYARQAFGSTNLSEEDWKKAEDHYKINLLYQDMLRKRQELDRLRARGQHKYEYDSDEETEGGTWEHKLRQQEMEATRLWANELTEKSRGRHHIGDFLPPDELERFLEKYNALKEGREPDLSDYKEFKLKEDNVGFKMLQKLGWQEGSGLGTDGGGIQEPVNKASSRTENQGLGVERPAEVSGDDDEFDAYRKRMMLAYRFRPNPLNNPRRPYY
ncbi:bromodomain-containing protein 4 isoform X2 [Diaphorina citri]|uniref:Bromodomain-containing protein 4 isoform X1 n=1 Tax=Diaphorina citri TaxID=121845 RepID=A0A1S4EJX5_DIACI|nr:bromodomain-containing protein 4 isoform X1 [Diaphorina citri]XP_017302444.1 bromodomain-containing protein 4 isoform X2 [Diaphorina citri]